MIETKGMKWLLEFLQETKNSQSINIRKLSAKLICELMHNNLKG